ncbi:MAG: AAA family ATPase [Lachnospiraceae bacterium]|nr:AAA family ATPase [Lachnospiraceae bacterium]
MKENNPFTLTFGKLPNEYISRNDNIYDIVSCFDADNPVSQTFLIEGVRGSGKTVLMTAVSADLTERKRWISVDLNQTQDLLKDLAMRLVIACKKAPDIMKTGFNISFAGFGVGINDSSGFYDEVSIIEEIMEQLKKKNKRLLITIDEVSNSENMRRFASQFQLFVRKDYPIFLIMTGLYDNLYSIQNDPSLTFLLRTPKIRTEPLGLNRIARQYSSIFEISGNEAADLAMITKGYAFAFQALGMIYYEHRNGSTLDEMINMLDDMLDDFVYKKIWSELSGRDRNIILSITEDRMKVGDICKKNDMTSNNFSIYRDRLIKKGILTSPQHGYLSIALPRFREVVSSYLE